MRSRSLLCLFLAAGLLVGFSSGAMAKHASSSKDQNVAVVIGEAGEQYPIYGAGGIIVSGGHHGFWASNVKSSAIQIDGTAISAQKFVPVNVSSSFIAVANGAYFVSNDSVCTLPTAVGTAGQEIIVCNTSKNAKITYQTVPGEALLCADQPAGPVVNSSLAKVDRLISDGKCWYRE